MRGPSRKAVASRATTGSQVARAGRSGARDGSRTVAPLRGAVPSATRSELVNPNAASAEGNTD